MPSWCEGVTSQEECDACPKRDTQHPCWTGKMLYYQGNDGRGGKIRFSRTCTPNAPRSNAMPRLPTPTREYEIRDERGVPLLDPKTGEPMTQKTADNMGSNFDKAMRDRDAMNKKLANEASNNKT